MDEHLEQHAPYPEREEAFTDKAFMQTQLSHLSVETIRAQIAEMQAHCKVLQEDLYTRARLHGISRREWLYLQLNVRGLLDFLQELRAGEPVQEEALQRRDKYVSIIRRYLDEPPAE